MKLTDDDSLRSVDDKGPSFSHQRQFTDIDLLLPHIQHLLTRPLIFLVKHHQADTKLQWNRKRHTLFETFALVVLWRTQGVTRKFEHSRVVVVGNREYAGQRRLQSIIFPTIRLDLKLQKLLIGTLLNFDQIRNIDVSSDARKIFPLDEFLKRRFGHSYSSTLVGGEQPSPATTLTNRSTAIDLSPMHNDQ